MVEDLNVAGMVRNRRFASAVSDASFAELRRQLTYKTNWNGGTLIVADRFYPSSKTCSECGWRKPSLLLSERRYTCEECGIIIDRDVNAARNLAHLASRVAASGAETLNARGGEGSGRAANRRPVKPAPMKREAGTTPKVDRTGTAASMAAA